MVLDIAPDDQESPEELEVCLLHLNKGLLIDFIVVFRQTCPLLEKWSQGAIKILHVLGKLLSKGSTSVIGQHMLLGLHIEEPTAAHQGYKLTGQAIVLQSEEVSRIVECFTQYNA